MRSVKAWVAAAAVVLAAVRPASAGPVESGTRISLGAVLKLTYTSRDRSERTGVTAISSMGISWLELDMNGELSERGSYVIELVANNGIYRDPISGTGTLAAGGPAGFGTIGVRKAEVRITDLIPLTTLRAGTFMPGWGIFQDRRSTDWELADLPLIYTRPDFRMLGWQNTGAALTFLPLEPVALDLAYVNGYFPGGLANAEPVLPGGGGDRGKAWIARLRLAAGPVSVYAAYLDEHWEEDRKGNPRPESYHAAAWIAGAQVSLEDFFAMFEWTDVTLEDYQLMTSGAFANLNARGGHATVGWRPLAAWEVVARWEWVDPNTSDTRKTFNLSRFDQVAQWTAGVNYRPGANAVVRVSFVMPEEEGHEVNVEQGEVGGKYQNRANNYFRVQLEVWQ